MPFMLVNRFFLNNQVLQHSFYEKSYYYRSRPCNPIYKSTGLQLPLSHVLLDSEMLISQPPIGINRRAFGVDQHLFSGWRKDFFKVFSHTPTRAYFKLTEKMMALLPKGNVPFSMSTQKKRKLLFLCTR